MTGTESVKAYFDRCRLDVLITPVKGNLNQYLLTLRELDRLQEFDLHVSGIFDPDDCRHNAPGSYLVDIPEYFTVCRECGCSEYNPCPDGCSWAEENLCSACAEKLQEVQG